MAVENDQRYERISYRAGGSNAKNAQVFEKDSRGKPFDYILNQKNCGVNGDSSNVIPLD